MGEQSTHSLAQHALSISNVRVDSGAGTGSFIKITPRGDWRNVTVGLQGDTCVNENADHSADFELTVLQSATVNEQLMALINMNTVRDGGVGVGALQLTNLKSGISISGDCVLTAPPEWDVQGEVQNAVWKGTIFDARYSKESA